VSAAPGIRDYALDQMNHLLTRLAFQIHRAAKASEPEEIHDVRASILRFSQAAAVQRFVSAVGVQKDQTAIEAHAAADFGNTESRHYAWSTWPARNKLVIGRAW
jgi:hypothetical protein